MSGGEGAGDLPPPQPQIRLERCEGACVDLGNAVGQEMHCRLIDGTICRHRYPGEDREPLTKDEANAMLAWLDQDEAPTRTRRSMRETDTRMENSGLRH